MNLNVLWAILSDLDPWLIGLGYGALTVLALWLLRSSARSMAAWRRRPRVEGDGNGTGLFYAAALAGMIVSLNTSWSYFGAVIGITDLVERGVMFFPLELAQLACGWGMRASIRRHGKPGPARFIAWFLCAISAYMAWGLSGFWIAVVRVMLGPVLSLVMLHLALGIEIRSLKVKDDSVLARVGQELRERLLAYLGLSDEGRDARAIARRRAVARAVHIYTVGKRKERAKRLFIRRLARADIANDPEALTMFINSMKLAANVERIHDLTYPMPFEVPGGTATQVPDATEQVPDATEQVPPGSATQVAPGSATGQMPGGTATEVAVPLDEVPPARDEVSVTQLSGTTKLQIDAIVKMIEKDGVDAVKIETIKERFGLPHTTAARRLRAAKSRAAS